MAKIRPLIRWHGGKYYTAKWIISHFPKHKIYVEPYGGAASCLSQKQPVEVEVYNDMDNRLVNLFTVVRDRGEEFSRNLALTPYSESLFQSSEPGFGDPIQQAVDFYVRVRQSRGGQQESFAVSTRRSRRGMADVVSGYLSSIDENLPRIIQRFRQVQILNRSALSILTEWDTADTLFYLDPPYLPSTVKNSDVYLQGMTEEEHQELAEVLNTKIIGKVVLSGYPSELYARLYSSWRVVQKEVPLHSATASTKRKCVEVLYLNF